jgi:hypothetical protein
MKVGRCFTHTPGTVDVRAAGPYSLDVETPGIRNVGEFPTKYITFPCKALFFEGKKSDLAGMEAGVASVWTDPDFSGFQRYCPVIKNDYGDWIFNPEAGVDLDGGDVGNNITMGSSWVYKKPGDTDAWPPDGDSKVYAFLMMVAFPQPFMRIAETRTIQLGVGEISPTRSWMGFWPPNNLGREAGDFVSGSPVLDASGAGQIAAECYNLHNTTYVIPFDLTEPSVPSSDWPDGKVYGRFRFIPIPLEAPL